MNTGYNTHNGAHNAVSGALGIDIPKVPYIEHLNVAFEECKVNMGWEKAVPEPIKTYPFEPVEDCGLWDLWDAYKAVKKLMENEAMITACGDLAGFEFMTWEQRKKEACGCVVAVHSPEFIE